MNYRDEDAGYAVQDEGQAYGRQCMNCGRVRRDVDGGWCANCSNPDHWKSEEYAAELEVRCVGATAKLTEWAKNSPRVQAQKREVERLWAEHQKRRKPKRPAFGPAVELVKASK
jgi:hypothetical protein